MAVLGRVVVADNEMRHVGGEIVLVQAAELGNLLGNVCLFAARLAEGMAMVVMALLGQRTNPLVRRDAGAADNDALERHRGVEAVTFVLGRMRCHGS